VSSPTDGHDGAEQINPTLIIAVLSLAGLAYAVLSSAPPGC